MSDAPRFEATPSGPQRGWFSRNWLWVVPGGLLMMCVCPIGCCAGFLASGLNAARQTEPYQTAWTRVQKDPVVVERLGEPIEEGGILGMQSQIGFENGQQTADITFPVSGPNGKATVRTTATLMGDTWQTESLVVTFDDGTEANLLDTGTVEPIPDSLDTPPVGGVPPEEPRPTELPDSIHNPIEPGVDGIQPEEGLPIEDAEPAP